MMPILERDPWREQYFKAAPCPGDVIIPTDDPDCCLLFERHRWVYEKLLIAQSQGLEAAMHGVMPKHYPVFSKPNINLKGMGVGSLVIHSELEMRKHNNPDYMWMPFLSGEHISSDCAVVDGALVWIRHATGYATVGGMFDYWKISAAHNSGLEDFLAAWIKKHMAGYSGMMNFETIGGTIIEAHLRFADQWPDLYGAGWVKALVGLYVNKTWVFDDGKRVDGFSVPLFGKHGIQFGHPCAKTQDEVRQMEHVSSLQITFHEAKAAANHAMPPGGFRLAIVNATTLEAGLAAREKLKENFPADQLLPA